MRDILIMKELTLEQTQKINKLKKEMLKELEKLPKKEYIPNTLDGGIDKDKNIIYHKYKEKINQIINSIIQ